MASYKFSGLLNKEKRRKCISKSCAGFVISSVTNDVRRYTMARRGRKCIGRASHACAGRGKNVARSRCMKRYLKTKC